MQDTGRLSGGAEARRAANPIRKISRHRPETALHADAAASDIPDVRTLGRLRRDMATFRADQVRRLAARDEASAGRRERQGVPFAGPRAIAASLHGRRGVPMPRIPVHLLAELALPCGLAAALFMFLNTFGSSYVAALAGQ